MTGKNVVSDLLGNLNEAQREAVMATEGPVIVLAGAGSGKTKTLTARVVHLMEKGAVPSSILAVTFTNKAAKEMKDRVANAIAKAGLSTGWGRWNEPWMGFSSMTPEVSTFHSFCLKLLRAEAEAAGLSRNFVIYDDADQLSTIKRIVDLLNLEGRLGNAKTYQSMINNAKTQAWGPGDIAAQGKSGPFHEHFLDVYQLYEGALKEAQAIDFGDIIVRAYQVLAARPDVLDRYQERFKYLMVDEYQDTNRAQYLLVTLLARKYRNLCVVGDEDQSIYKWRGADIRNILDFKEEYADAKLVKLEENYRSTKTIIEAASHVIRNNKDRYDKVLFTNNAKGDPIRVVELGDERAEGEFVAREIRKWLEIDPRRTAKDIAIFYRSHAQSRAVEEALRKDRTAYKVIGNVGFYDRKEVKDVMSYLRLAVNPHDTVSLERVINVPARGIGRTTVDKLLQHGHKAGISLYGAMEEVVRGQVDLLAAGAVKKLRGFYDFLENVRASAQHDSLADIYQKVVTDSGYIAELKSEDTEEAKGRVENLEEFYSVVQNFENEAKMNGLEPQDDMLRNFLSQLTLESQALEAAEEGGKGFVSMMTLHSSKGLEFPLVFLVGCEEGIFPSKRAVDESEWEDSAIEEERRLCYVGITRAMRHLIITYASVRRIYGQVQVSPPSRFLDEIPATHKKHEAKSHMAPVASWSAKSYAEARGSATRYDYRDSQALPPAVDIEVSYGDTGEQLEVGRKVSHAVYGKGTIRAIEGTAADRKVTIEFSGYQKKKFLVKHVKLELL